MQELVIFLLFILGWQTKYIFKLTKKISILHNNNINLGQALVECGGMTYKQFKESILKKDVN